MHRITVKIVVFLSMTLGGIPLGTAALAEPIKVVTTFTVLADMAKNVAQEHAQVVSITKPNAEIHGYQPTPRDILHTSDADLILQNGLNLEAWFERFYVRMKDVPTAVISKGIDAIPLDPKAPESGMNPHGWMSLANAKIYVENIALALAEVDPKNADHYWQNARNYLQKIDAALAPSKEVFEEIPQEARWLTSCEGAFSYLARDLGLKELYLWPVNADQIALPKQIQHVIDTVRTENIKVVFCESTVSAKPAKQVARETGAAFGGILYVDSLSQEGGPVASYIDLLTITTNTIAQGIMTAQ